ncbi:MAG: ISAzo13 family transposase, partial [Bryobacterales bacterium]|nr:ISAzo13 family transposase [Bryobacterales bacterium]
DPASYPTGVEVTDAQIEALSLQRHTFHGEWNYDLCPRPTKS